MPCWAISSRSRAIFLILNDKICVKKGHAQGFGQQHPQGALAHTGHADENDVVQSVILPLYRLISELV